MTSKDVIKWLYGKVREEMTIQKPSPVVMTARKEETRENRILKTGLNGFAMIGLICVVMAFLVF